MQACTLKDVHNTPVTFEIPNNNLDAEFEKAYQNHNNEILWTRKENQISQNLNIVHLRSPQPVTPENTTRRYKVTNVTYVLHTQ